MPEVCFPIPGDCLKAGNVITIQGITPDGTDRSWYRITGEDHDDVLLSVGTRFSADCVTFNTKTDGDWDEELKKDGNPLKLNRSYEITIRVLPDKYKIALNGEHVFDFEHRKPIDTARCIKVQNDNFVTNVSVEGTKLLPEEYESEINENFSVGARAAISGVKLPYNGALPQPLKPGTLIQIDGETTDESARWVMRLQANPGTGDDNIAFNFANHVEKGCYVRNSKTDGEWDNEQRSGDPIPPGEPFDLACLVTESGYKVSMNGEHVCDFEHRMDMDVVNVVHISGCAKVHGVFIHQ